MNNGEIQKQPVRYEVNGEEHIFTNERTHVYLFVNRPEMSRVKAVTGFDITGYDARGVTMFGADVLRFFSGIPMLSETVTADEAIEDAKEICDKYGWSPNVHFMLDPPEEIQEQFEVAKKLRALKQQAEFEKEFSELIDEHWPSNGRQLDTTETEEGLLFQNEDGEDPDQEVDPNEILLDYQVGQIGRRVLYGYFPKKWYEEQRVDIRNKEIFGSQLKHKKS